MIAQFAELLPASLPSRVHEASLDVLEHVGLLVRNDEGPRPLPAARVPAWPRTPRSSRFPAASSRNSAR